MQNLILDTSILVAAQRRGDSVAAVLRDARHRHGNIGIAISAGSLVELTHGIYRSDNPGIREKRRIFTEMLSTTWWCIR